MRQRKTIYLYVYIHVKLSNCLLAIIGFVDANTNILMIKMELEKYHLQNVFYSGIDIGVLIRYFAYNEFYQAIDFHHMFIIYSLGHFSAGN